MQKEVKESNKLIAERRPPGGDRWELSNRQGNI